MLHEFMIRVDAINNNTKKDFLSLLNDISLKEALVTEEIAAKSKKVHFHAQVCMESHKKTETLAKNLRENLKKKLQVQGHELYVKKTKNLEDSLVYILKDGKIILNTYKDQDMIKECQEQTMRINKEKKKSMKHQLLEYFKDIDPCQLTLKYTMHQIIEYHTERDYLPPSRTLLTQYTAYVLAHTVKRVSDTTYNDQIMQLYGFTNLSL